MLLLARCKTILLFSGTIVDSVRRKKKNRWMILLTFTSTFTASDHFIYWMNWNEYTKILESACCQTKLLFNFFSCWSLARARTLKWLGLVGYNKSLIIIHAWSQMDKRGKYGYTGGFWLGVTLMKILFCKTALYEPVLYVVQYSW